MAATTIAVAMVASFDVAPVSAATTVGRAPVIAFQAAGDVGGGVLEPGTTYPPTSHGVGMLVRGRDWIRMDIRTSNLPPGAYTVWWVVFDAPSGCSGPCDSDDLLNPAAGVSVFYATGGVVRERGIAAFRAHHRIGGDLGEPGTQHVLGDGTIHPRHAEIHNIIKYHGPASDDPATLHAQVTTLLGSCESGANAVDLGPVFGIHCFDPQAVAHRM